MGSRTLRQYFHVDYRPGERKLVQKIDFFILTFCCLSYLVNYVCGHHRRTGMMLLFFPLCLTGFVSSPLEQLDRSNLANAYVSGMKEDLGFSGDQLNQINTCFTVG